MNSATVKYACLKNVQATSA